MKILNLYYSYGINNVRYKNNRFIGTVKTVQFLGQNKYRTIQVGDTPIDQRYINIRSFRRVDGYVYRGGKPSVEKIRVLKNMGIDTIIDFTNGNDSLGNINYEERTAKSLGMSYINLPFSPSENPPEEHIEKFFKIVEHARKDNKKVYIHCQRGHDRTGLFASMYKLKYNIADIETCIREMLEYGHNRNYISHITFLRKFCRSL